MQVTTTKLPNRARLDAIVDAIRPHEGRQQPLSVELIAWATGESEAYIRKSLTYLDHQYGAVIVPTYTPAFIGFKVIGFERYDKHDRSVCPLAKHDDCPCQGAFHTERI